MRYLTVGSAKRISKIGLGTFQFGSPEWGYGQRYAETEAHAIVRRALDLGVTLFDTADIYSAGRSERILGRALGADREAVIIATKLFPLLPGVHAVRHRAIASAKRLGVSRLDLYQVHWPNPFITDRAIMGGMRQLQDRRLIDDVGVSGYSTKRWQSAEQMLGRRVLSNQVAYSLLERSPERDLLPFADTTDHPIIAFSPLAKGLLSGRYHSRNRPVNYRASDPLFQPENLDRITDLIAVLRDVGYAHSATPAQIALAWAIHPPAVAAIPGASSVEQLELNVAAADIRLTEQEYQALQSASDRARPRRATEAPAHHNRAAARHLAKGGKYMAKTVFSDIMATLRPHHADLVAEDLT